MRKDFVPHMMIKGLNKDFRAEEEASIPDLLCNS